MKIKKLLLGTFSYVAFDNAYVAGYRERNGTKPITKQDLLFSGWPGTNSSHGRSRDARKKAKAISAVDD